MSKINLQPPRGTRDFYPDDMRARNALFAVFRETARRFGFEEVDAPVLEHAELYERKAGEEITEQLYHFALHERRLALRPEFTPSLARMVMARRGALRFPLRWFSLPQCWRYERMTRGRRREHYQWNMDVWGEASVAAEAELVAALFAALDAFGVPAAAVTLRINHRALLEETLRRDFLAKRPEVFEALCIVLDKLDKLGADAVAQQLADPHGRVALDAGAARELVARFSQPGLDAVAARAAKDSPALSEIRQLFEWLDAYGLRERVQFDAACVRGLAYYTGVVFEARDTRGELRALAGGGRYDRLLESFGGAPLPAAGFGFGDAVLSELLSAHKLLPTGARALDAVVYAMSDAERPAALRVAKHLRAKGQAVEVVLAPLRAKRVFADADKSGAARVYIVGASENARGVVKVRELATGAEREEPQA